MIGELLSKKLPKYKLEAMQNIVDICHKEVSPHIGDSYSKSRFEEATYRFENSHLIINLGNIVVPVILSGDFPRVYLSANNQPLIAYSQAKSLIKSANALSQSTPMDRGFETLLFIEFSLPSKQLKVFGRYGTRVIYKGE